jgi:hypothetical protein
MLHPALSHALATAHIKDLQRAAARRRPTTTTSAPWLASSIAAARSTKPSGAGRIHASGHRVPLAK